jgi:glycosyltransferase involved in cell wall biosynthesis
MPRKIKVVHFSDMPTGGAAVAANRLVRGLASSNEVSVERWVFGKSEVADLPVEQLALERGYPKTCLERSVRVFSRQGVKALQRIRQRKALHHALATRKPDVLHLHNLHASALCHSDLLTIPRNVRIVWTMHDEWPVAPWAYHWQEPDGQECFQGKESAEGQHHRAHFFRERSDVVLVSPSRWLGEQARAHCGTNIQIQFIPYGLDAKTFTPQSKAASKESLGLDTDCTWLGLAAASFDRRKGADVLREAVAQIKNQPLGLAIWGPTDQSIWPNDILVKQFGFVGGGKMLASLYSAVDLFVCPSRIDNLPNTILESMACGTPVVGSNTGGIPEMVRPGETGWLYDKNNPQSCATVLQEALQSKEQRTRYAVNSRELIAEDFSLERQAASYIALYRGLR